jgi:hypothetical protein
MRTLRIIVAGATGLCLLLAAVAGYRLAGAAETPSLGEAIVVRPGPTSSTTRTAARRPPVPSSASPRIPPPTAAAVSPPPVQDAGDDDPDDGDDDTDGD